MKRKFNLDKSLNIKLALLLYLFFLSQYANSSNSNSLGIYKSLFNERNYDGWIPIIRNGNPKEAKKVFHIRDKLIHVYANHADGYQLNEKKNDTHGVLFTADSYSRYSFKLEYKWGEKKTNNFSAWQYDAGLFYHVTEAKIWPRGLEYQIRYNHLENRNHTGDLWNLSGGPVTVYSNGKNIFKPWTQGGTVTPLARGEFFALQNVQFNALNNKWNTVEIIVMDSRYAIHKLNGKIVNILTDLPHSSGKIGLQAETAEIYYRNIRIKQFENPVPIDQFIE